MDKHFANFKCSLILIGIAGTILLCATALQLVGQTQCLTQFSGAIPIVIFLKRNPLTNGVFLSIQALNAGHS